MDADLVKSGTFPSVRNSFSPDLEPKLDLKTYFELYSNRKPWSNYLVTHLHPTGSGNFPAGSGTFPAGSRTFPAGSGTFRLDPEHFWLVPELFRLDPELFRLDPELFWLEGFRTGIVLLRIQTSRPLIGLKTYLTFVKKGTNQTFSHSKLSNMSLITYIFSRQALKTLAAALLCHS
jgi:hypothetical protein